MAVGRLMSDGTAATPSANVEETVAGALTRPGTLVRILLVFLVAKLVILAALALNSAFVMDEYWMAVHGLFNADHLYKEIWPSKTVLYAPVFRIPHVLAESSVQIMLVARAEMTAVAVAALGLLYLVARQIGRSRLEAIFLVALVLSFRSQIEWAFLTRPEPLALFYALAALWLVTRGRGGLALCFAAGLVSGVAFLTLQKAVYFNLALGLALIGDGLMRRALKDAVAAGATLVLGWGLVVGAYYLFFMALGVDFVRTLEHSLAGPALQNALVGHNAYGGGLSSFVGTSLARDLALYLVCLAGLLSSWRRLLRMDTAERRAWIFTVVITILVYSHRAPWPYNFVMAIPFLGLWSPVLFRAIPTRLRLSRMILVGIVAGFMGLSFVHNARYFNHDNTYQNQTVRRVESLLQPEDRYFDGIGMVVDRKHAGWDLPGQVVSWDRPAILGIRAAAEQGDQRHLERVFGGAPKVWILTYRSDALGELLTPYFENSYVPIYSNVLITGVELVPGETVAFRNWWPGVYRLYRADGTPAEAGLEIVGRRVEGPLRIGKGRHSLRLTEDEGPLYLLPADIENVAFDMTAAREQQVLFDRVYTY